MATLRNRHWPCPDVPRYAAGWALLPSDGHEFVRKMAACSGRWRTAKPGRPGGAVQRPEPVLNEPRLPFRDKTSCAGACLEMLRAFFVSAVLLTIAGPALADDMDVCR